MTGLKNLDPELYLWPYIFFYLLANQPINKQKLEEKDLKQGYSNLGNKNMTFFKLWK